MADVTQPQKAATGEAGERMVEFDPEVDTELGADIDVDVDAVVGLDAEGQPDLRPIDRRSRRRSRDAYRVEGIALRLFAKQGYNQVTVAAVAEAADISTRTFYRYFPAKEDAVLAGIVARIQRVPLDYWERPVDEPVVLALRRALTVVADGASFAGDPVERHRSVVLAAEPWIARRGLERLHAIHGELCEQTALRMRVDWRTDPRPGIIVGAMAGGLQAGWLAAASSQRTDEISRFTAEALDLLVPALSTLV